MDAPPESVRIGLGLLVDEATSRWNLPEMLRVKPTMFATWLFGDPHNVLPILKSGSSGPFAGSAWRGNPAGGLRNHADLEHAVHFHEARLLVVQWA